VWSHSHPRMMPTVFLLSFVPQGPRARNSGLVQNRID
jgi:hypothetical protein